MTEIVCQFFLSALSLFLLFIFIRFVNKIWWTPVRLQLVLRQQGIKGPPYRLIYGNTKEIQDMSKQSISTRPMGLSHDIFPRVQPHLYSWLKDYGKNFVSWHGPRPQIFITDTDLVKETLNKNQTYPKTDTSLFAKMLLGDGLVESKGEKWAKHRKLANHAFHAESLKSMTPVMIASVGMMLERWKQYEGKEIDVHQEFKILTSEVISRTAFGSSYEEGKNIFDMLIQLVILLSRNAYNVKIPGISLFYRSGDEIGAEKLERGVHDKILSIMEKRENASTERGELGSLGTDFLGLLMKAKNDPNERNRITAQDVVDECRTFYIAGQETTTNLLAWLFFLLGIHTDWQEAARKEVVSIFGREIPNLDGIAKMKTVQMIINETLRLYSPAIILRRQVKEEAKLGDLNLPANVDIVISILALHHDKQIWGDDVLQFKPERFSQGVAKATNNNPALFFPFGLGPRSCVGMNFAMNEAKIAIAMILQRYSFTLSPTYIHSPVINLTLTPKHGVQVVLQPV